jgi:hypothetical protein
LSTLALWGQHSSQRLTEDTIDRLSQAELAGAIAGEQANISIDMGKMVLSKKAGEALLNELQAYAKTRDAAIDEFRALTNNPAAMQQAAEMAAIASKRTAANDHIIALLRAGKYRQATIEYGWPLGKLSLRVKAKEASDLERQLVAANEKKRKTNSSIVLLACGRLLFRDGGGTSGRSRSRSRYRKAAGYRGGASGSNRGGRLVGGRARRISDARRRNRHAGTRQASHDCGVEDHDSGGFVRH